MRAARTLAAVLVALCAGVGDARSPFAIAADGGTLFESAGAPAGNAPALFKNPSAVPGDAGAIARNTNAGAAIARGPYLQLLTSTSTVIRWRTDTAEIGVVRFGLKPNQLRASATEAKPTTEHELRLAPLEPATRYFYSVGTSKRTWLDAAPERSFVTAPPTGSPGPTRIWVIGDAGTGNDSARRVRDAYLKRFGGNPPDVWLLLGDNAYPDGSDADHQRALFDMFAPVLARTAPWPVIGNHDANSSDPITQRGPYFQAFTLPTKGEAGGVPSGTESYYSFDHANIHFVALDSQGSDRSRDGPMLRWLERDLAATKADWIIAYWHHPPYSHGGHDSDTDRRMIDMRAGAVPILEKYGADLVLGGHSHSYERSHLLAGNYGPSSSLTSAMILGPGDGRIEGNGAYRKRGKEILPILSTPKPFLFGRQPFAFPPVEHVPKKPLEGTVYVVVGSSGQTTGGPFDHPVMEVSAKRLGSLSIVIDGATLLAEFIDDTGKVVDTFSIVKDLSNR